MKLPHPGADFILAPSGTHLAACYGIVDLGTQKVEWEGKIDMKSKIVILWELMGDAPLMEDGRPFSVNKTYTLSTHKKATMRIDLEGWRGVPFEEKDFGTFDIQRILKKCCLLNIVHDKNGDRTYAHIKNISTPMKNQPIFVDVTKNPITFFSMMEGEFDQKVFDSLPDWMKKKIEPTVEFRRAAYGEVIDDKVELVINKGRPVVDDIPF